MSVFVRLSDLQKLQTSHGSQLHNMIKDLTVESMSKEEPKFNFQTRKMDYGYGNVKQRIDAYKIFMGPDNTKLVCLPLSYYFHHWQSVVPRLLSNGKNVTFPTFSGSLLPRQQAIEENALEIIHRTGSVLLCLHTGFGKTIFTIYLCSKLGMKTLILCHRTIIMQQWMEAIEKYLPGCKAVILSSKSKSFDNADIVIANALLIPKLDISMYSNFGTLVVDEVHTICTKQFSQALFMVTPKYLIGLSATPKRSDGMDVLLELYIGPEMINRPMKRHFHVYKYSTGFVPECEYTVQGKLNWNSVLVSQSSDHERNVLLCKLIWYFGRRNILVLVKLKEHALVLKQMLKQIGEDVDVFMDNMKQVNYSCRVLIATFSKGGVGFDHPKLDMLIGAADVEENFMQYLGRVFRRDDIQPIYIDLKDNMSRLVTHSKTRIGICEEVGGQVYDFKKTFKQFSTLTDHLFK
jgi:superfamily II DNA or RNA helicase